MLLRNTLLYLPAQVVGPLFQLISVVAWTHVTAETTLGVITLVTATHELLQTLFLFWWSQFALRSFGSFRSAEDAARFHRTENLVLLVSTAIQCAVAIVILRVEIAPGAGAALTLAVAGYVVTRSFNLYFAERARASGQIGVYTIQQITGPALGFLLGLLLILLLGDAPEWPIAGYAVAQALAALAAFPLIGLGRAVWPPDRAILRQALRYGVPLLAGGGLAWVSANASRFIISDMLGLGAAGLFAVGYGLGWRAAAIAALTVTAGAFPLAVAKMEREGSAPALQQLSDNGALLAALLFPSVAGVFMLREEIVHLLIAPSFQQATLAVLPLAVLAGAMRNFRGHFSDQAFLLHRRTGILIAINGVEAALTVMGALLLIPRWGLAGGVLSSVAATAIAAMLSFAMGIAVFGLRPPALHLAKIAAATAAMMAVLSMLPDKANAIALVLHIALGAAVYAAVLAMLYGRALAGLWDRLRLKELAIAYHSGLRRRSSS
jgi:O-antigen/teichoic acid export membrane protein